MKKAHEIAGGEKDIAVYLIANENAIPFYEKLGKKKQKMAKFLPVICIFLQI